MGTSSKGQRVSELAAAFGDAPLEVISHAPHAAVLLRAESSACGYFAGSLSAVSLAEVFGQIIAGARHGQLLVGHAKARYSISVRHGQVVYATSSEPHGRLGSLLVRKKLILASQLDKALREAKPPLRLGEVLKRTGLISGSALYAAMVELVEEITLSLFELSQGHAFFIEGPLPTEDSVKLSRRTKELVLEGLKRADELQRLLTRFPSTMRVAKGDAVAPTADVARVERAKNGVELAALRGEDDISEYGFLRWVAQAFESGVLVQAPAASPSTTVRQAASAAPSAPDIYGALIQEICKALTQAGAPLGDVRSFLEDPLPGMEAAFHGVQLTDDGTLDTARVIANATAQDARLGRAKAYEALEAFVSYALFTAKSVVEPAVHDALAKKLRRAQQES